MHACATSCVSCCSVLNVLQKWLASNLDDFLDNPELLTIFREFLSRRTSADMPFRRQLLQRAFTNEVRRPSACSPSARWTNTEVACATMTPHGCGA